MFMTLRGEPHLLWRANDKHGVELAVLAVSFKLKCDTGFNV
jgi:hypothetical protein